MAYSTGISSTMADLVAAIRTFALAQGFAASSIWSGGTAQTGAISVMAFSKGAVFYHLAWNNSYMMLNTATASSGVGMPEAQPGANPKNQIIGAMPAPHVGYHLFSQGDRIHCVVERATNVFVHLSFGQIDKVGNWAGGAYVAGSMWSESIRTANLKYNWNDPNHSRPFEGIASYSANVQIGTTTYASLGSMRTDYDALKTMEFTLGPYRSNVNVNTGLWSAWFYGYELLQDSPNSFNNRAALVPVQINMQSVPSGSDETQFSRLQMGQLADVAAINMAFINPKDMINNDWMVFPLCQKNGDGINYVNSVNNGLAYKK